jgi:FtsH-binding integral membrane protein
MANWSDPQTTATGRPAGIGAQDVAFDAGLRSYMLSVYNYMASGVLLTGIVSLLFSMGGADSYAARLLQGGGILPIVIIFSPLALIWWLSLGIQRMSETTAKTLYWAQVILNGLSLSMVLLHYTGASIAAAFFGSAAAFGSLSLYGYTTQRNLAPIGTFLMMGLIGIIVAMLINLFFHSSTMTMLINVIGVLIIAGLTAWSTQQVKSMYYSVQGSDFFGKSVVLGALVLYLNFLNMFQFLLSIMGNRR